MDWEFGISRCKLLYIEWINNKVLLYSIGNYIQYPIMNHYGKEKKCFFKGFFPLKYQLPFFVEIEKSALKLIWNLKGSQIVKAILRKRNRTGGIRFPDFRLYHKATVIRQYGTGTKKTYKSMEQNR